MLKTTIYFFYHNKLTTIIFILLLPSTQRGICLILTHCIFLGPRAGGGLVFRSVGLVHVCNLRYQRIIRVRVCQKRANGKQDLRNSKSRAPLLFEDVEANAAIAVDVRMKYLCSERNLRRLEWIVWGEVNVHQENTTGKWAIGRTHDCSLPMKNILSSRSWEKQVLILVYNVQKSNGSTAFLWNTTSLNNVQIHFDHSAHKLNFTRNVETIKNQKLCMQNIMVNRGYGQRLKISLRIAGWTKGHLIVHLQLNHQNLKIQCKNQKSVIEKINIILNIAIIWEEQSLYKSLV